MCFQIISGKRCKFRMLGLILILQCTLICSLIIIAFILYNCKEHYKNMALLDPLTGAYSRSYLNIIKKERNSSRHKGPPISTLVEIDVDKFKEINDRYGHAIGDMVLQYIVNVFKESIRKGDSVIRIGGDEFIIIFNDCTEEIAINIMNRIEYTFKDNCVFDFPIEFTYGIEQLNQNQDIEEALIIADTKMYDLKSKRCEKIICKKEPYPS